MGKLVMSQEDEVLETAILKALDILKHQGSINISLAKTIIENIGIVEPRQANLCLRAFRHDKF